MTRAQGAPVRPRVYVPGSTGTLLLQDEVARFLAAGRRGLIAIVGPAGSGKTTALEHLAAVLPPDHWLRYLDEPDAAPGRVIAPVRLVVYAATSERPQPHLAVYRLAPWTQDDLIEYLLTVHRPRCAAVMARIHPQDQGLLGGVPELWRVVLDRLAEDDPPPNVRRALNRHLESHLCDTDLLERARSACLNFLLSPGADFTLRLKELAKPGFAEDLIRLLQHQAAQVLLASERIMADLHGDGACDYLAKRLPRDLVRAAASLAVGNPHAVEHLHRLLAGPSWSHAMTASLLHATGTGWMPEPQAKPDLAGAYLDGIFWPDVDLSGANLARTELFGAILRRANLKGANAQEANLRMACLSAATLDGIGARGADLAHADLANVSASKALFNSARLEHANFDGAVLRDAFFIDAKLAGATFRSADLSGARFIGSVGGNAAYMRLALEGADFTEANLTRAVLSGLCLRVAVWTRARFTGANLASCDLEYLTLPAADFTEARLDRALLTGTSMPGACFHRADLRESGLADVDWEGADLRGADIRGCSFHLGSTRSGLVGSPIACEGSRTGFYTDDYDDQTYKAPEEIRKANLCGADLRGTNLEGVDFYLVDLRGALLDADQELHLRRCGAILGARV